MPQLTIVYAHATDFTLAYPSVGYKKITKLRKVKKIKFSMSELEKINL